MLEQIEATRLRLNEFRIVEYGASIRGNLPTNLHFWPFVSISFRRMIESLPLTNATTDVMARHTRRHSSFNRLISHTDRPSSQDKCILKDPRGRRSSGVQLPCHARAENEKFKF